MPGAIEPAQVDMPKENENTGAEEHEEQNYIVENPSLDLECHSNAYIQLAKLYRLQAVSFTGTIRSSAPALILGVDR